MACTFIDFSKAFDTLSHTKLLLKLNACEMSNLSDFQITYLIPNS